MFLTGREREGQSPQWVLHFQLQIQPRGSLSRCEGLGISSAKTAGKSFVPGTSKGSSLKGKERLLSVPDVPAKKAGMPGTGWGRFPCQRVHESVAACNWRDTFTLITLENVGNYLQPLKEKSKTIKEIISQLQLQLQQVAG